jgi:hypothetical protein
MKSTWRKHFIICLFLGLLAVPIYFLDRAFLGPKAGGGNWIKLDFRGLIFWSYIIVIAIDVPLSSIAVLLSLKSGALRIHFGSFVISLVLFVTGMTAYEKLHRLTVSNEYRALMEHRRHLSSMVELKEWWYFPNESDPTEIRVSVLVHQSGRFAGNVTGEQTDPSGSSTTVFESADGPESQRQVSGGDAFTYGFPLKVLTPGHADNVQIALYLFKAPNGPAIDDIEKIFMRSPQQDDDGQFLYGVLPDPSQPGK